MPVALLGRVVAFALAAAAARATAGDPPNIVFMLSDDQGWDGLSVEMAPGVAGAKSPIIQTPNLERLAAQGFEPEARLLADGGAYASTSQSRRKT